MLTCANCSTQNDPNRKFCVECGHRLAGACPVCGTENPAAAKFCGECGTTLAAAGQAAATAATDALAVGAPVALEPVAERRLVSVLFVDLVGFTSASEQRDAEDTRELLTRYFDLARETVGRHGGVIEKFIGDAVMAVWGTPIAHEDDAERAVRAALELVSAVSVLDADAGLRARAGVLTGEAAVTIGQEAQGMVAGDMVNTASRLQSAAEPGTVLVGESTQRAAAGAIAFEEMEAKELKGKEAPVRVWRAVAVVARRGGQGRTAALEPPFVGRDEELRLLKDQLHATAREGKPRLVTIVGQAGIGKSRLAWELEKYLDGLVETVLWHEGRSPSYGEGISYWALAEIVRGRAGIAESEDPDAARAKVSEMLAGLALEPAERHWIEPRLTGLLGLDELPSESREELFAAWRMFFERLSQQATGHARVLGSPVGRSGAARLHRAPARLGAHVADLRRWPRHGPSCSSAARAGARTSGARRQPTWSHCPRPICAGSSSASRPGSPSRRSAGSSTVPRAFRSTRSRRSACSSIAAR